MPPAAALLACILLAQVDPKVPSPQSFFGHAIGAEPVRYEPMMRYLEALDAASDAVTIAPTATTHEGRTLVCLTITSTANHARLERIKADNARLADPRGLGEAEAAAIVRDLPGVAWMAYSIHGDELSSTDAAIEVAYTLAAGSDEPMRRLREELIVLIDPLQNPDGRERYLAQLQTLRGKVPNPDVQATSHGGLWSAGRGNHYLFDLNRDWLAMAQPETRGRSEAIRGWNPHLLVDSHEMGPLETYLFDPPREPYTLQLGEKTLHWRRRFSADQAAAFDLHGWSYYTGEWYEEWYPGYTNAWASLQGAVGLLYEQASVDGTLVRQATGRDLTYAEAVRHQVVSSFANLQTLRANCAAILADFLADRRWAVSDEGPWTETFLMPPGADPSRFRRFIETLDLQGIEHERAPGAIEASGAVDGRGARHDRLRLPAGTLVVRSQQPRRRLLHAILGFDPHMSATALRDERTELERRRETRVYDVTAWSLPMAFGLDAYWADSAAPADAGAAPGGDAPGAAAPAAKAPAAPYGWLIDGDDSAVFAALARLFDAGLHARVASKPFTAGGKEYRPGAVLLRRHENPQSAAATLEQIAAVLGLQLRPVGSALAESGPDLGGERFHLLQVPRVAIASQWPIGSSSFGTVWSLLDDRLRLRASPVNVQSLGAIDLRLYNVLVLPDAESPEALAAVLGPDTLQALRQWVEGGGTLIAIGSAAAFAAGKDRGLSGVRLRQDVLDRLDEYEEALARERASREIRIDEEALWDRGRAAAPEAPPAAGPAPAAAPGTGPGSGASDRAKAGEPGKDADSLRRADEWARVFSPQGAIAEARLDPEHWLCFGLGETLPVLLSGTQAYMSAHPVATPARLAPSAEIRLSGLLWPEARDRWADTAWATVESRGHGQVILFAADPFFRGHWEGSGRLLENAVLLGPGLGATPPLPW